MAGHAQPEPTIEAPVTADPQTTPSLDLEELARNLARMIEDGGKALAAYMKPREQGHFEGEHAEFVDAVKALGHVAQYWLQDPQRAAGPQIVLVQNWLEELKRKVPLR